MERLIELLEICNNINTLTWSADTRQWTIEYKSDLSPDVIDSGNLIDFLDEE